MALPQMASAQTAQTAQDVITAIDTANATGGTVGVYNTTIPNPVIALSGVTLPALNAGTVNIGTGSLSTSLSGGSITDNATLAFLPAQYFPETISTNISGTGSVTTGSTGQVTLSGTNTYTGGTLDQGALVLANTAALPAGNYVTVNYGSVLATEYALDQNTLDHIATLTTADKQTTGVVALAADSANPLDFTRLPALYLGAYDPTVKVVPYSSKVFTYSGTITPGLTNGTPTIHLGGGNAILNVASGIADVGGATAVTVGGNYAYGYTWGADSILDTVILSGTNSFTGGLTVGEISSVLLSSKSAYCDGTFSNCPRIVLGVDATLATGYALDQATINALTLASTSTGGATASVALAANSSNDLNFSGLNTLALGSLGNYTYSGTLTPSAAGFFLGSESYSILAGAYPTLTVTSDLAGAYPLYAIGNLVLTGANSYTGATYVGSGNFFAENLATLQLGDGVHTGTIANTTSVNLDPQGAGTYDAYAGGRLVFNEGSAITFAIPISGTPSSLGMLLGGGGITQIGPGTVTLTADESYSGTTQITNSTLAIGAGGSIAASGAVALTSNGTTAPVLDISQGGDQTVQNLSSTTATGSPAASVVLGANRLTVLTETNAYWQTDYLGSTISFDGVISGTGGVTKDGALTWQLSGANTYSGSTIIADGTVLGAWANTFSPNSAVTLDSGATLDLGGYPQAIGGLSGAGTVTNSGASYAVLTITGASSTFSGVIADGTSQTGLDFNAPGATLTLTGAQTYTGATWIAAGELAVNGTLASPTVTVADGGALGGSGTVSGTANVLSGGALVGSSGQTLTLGSLSLASGASLDVALGAPSTSPVFSVTGDLTLAGTLYVTDAGGFGQGVYRLIDYGGTLTDNGLVLAALPYGDLGSIQTSVAQQVNLIVSSGMGSVAFWNGTTTTPAGTIVGGNGTWTAGGSTNWTNASGTAVGPWNGVYAVFEPAAGQNGATVQVSDANGAVAITGAQFIGYGWTVDGDAITLNAPSGQTAIRVGDGTSGGAGDSATIAAPLIGTTGLTKTDLGTLILIGANTYTGGTTIAAGTLQIGNGGTTGSIAGDVVDNGALVFARSDAVTFAGAISGSGSVTQAGSGTLTLSGANSYGGGTNVYAGTLDVQSAAALGTGMVTMEADTALILDGTGFNVTNALELDGRIEPTLTVRSGTSDTWSGVISGTAPLTVNGGGTLTLTADNSYGGATIVSGTGTWLIVDGSIAASSLTTLNAGTMLSGTGTVGALSVGAGATFAPGSGTAGTGMTVAGNLTFAKGATYAVALSPTTASAADVKGTATLTGANVAASFASGTYITKKYTILTASGGLGGTTFAGLSDTGLPSGFEATLSYDGDDVYLDLVAALNGGARTGLPGNQQVLVNTINDYFNGGGALPTSFVGLFALTGSTLGQSLQTMTGEAATGASEIAFRTTDQFLGVMLDHPSCPLQSACRTKSGMAMWGTVLDAHSRTDGDASGVGSNALSGTTGGFAMGLEALTTGGSTLGVALAMGRSDWNLANGLGSGRADFLQTGLYGQGDLGPIRAGAAFAWTHMWTTTDREALGNAGLHARYHADDFAGRLEADYRPRRAEEGLVPYAAVQTQRFDLPTYAEEDVSGEDGFGLTIQGRDFHDTRAEVGAMFDQTLGSPQATALHLHLRGAYAHHWVRDPRLDAGFTALPGSAFTVTGAAPARNTALVSAGIELRIAHGATIYGKADGEIAPGAQNYRGAFGIRYIW